MTENDEVVQLLREIRDIERQRLDLTLDRWAQHDVDRKRWLESEETRYAEYRQDYLADAAKNTHEYEKAIRSYVRMTAAYTAMCIAIVIGIAGGAVFLFWPR